MEEKMNGTNQCKKDVPSGNENGKENMFLKVSPNLFTPERLHLFDSLDLYTSLIKCSKSTEQGERLHNLSWRIMNKALLKDHNINKSKKREGVKNLYYVLNPITNKQPLQQQQQQHLQQQQLKDQSDKRSSSANSTPSLRSPTAVKKQIGTVSRMEPLSKVHTTNVASNDISHSSSNNSGSLFSGAKQHKSTSALTHIGRTQSHHHQPYKNKKEDPQTIVKGFDPNTIITAPKTKNVSTSLRKSKNNFDDKNTFYIEATPSPEPDKANSSNTSMRKALPSRQESLFGKPKNTDNNVALSSSRNSNLFFSSEEEDEEDDSDFDDDSLYEEDDDFNYGDDDEEDQYYRKQWDKLLFAKNAAANSSGNVTPNSASSHDQIKRSLLSGLFLNEQVNGNNKSRTTSPLAQSPLATTSSSVVSPYVPISTHSNTGSRKMNQKRATLETSNITAVGSVTPPDKSLPEVLYKETSRSSRGSFSSIVSESTRERYTGQSNAPPAAQTILPTALSTHMFVPNNVHQQRLAMAAAADSRPGSAEARPSSMHEFRRRSTRRESMDIPSKNKNNTFIKTRMEISEEEKMVRAYSRRNL